jgi:hypothetical protein
MRTLKHTESRSRWYTGESGMSRWYDDENTMVRWWKHDGTNVKQQLYDGKTTTLRKNDITIVIILWYNDETAMASWWKRDIIFTFLSSHHRYVTIVPSLLSSSYRCTIALSSFYHRASRLRETKNVTYIQKEHRNRRYLNGKISWQYRRNLAYRFTSRTLTRDKESFKAIYR